MAKKLQLRGGTTSQHSSFTGAVREVTVDTDKKSIVVHDGSTAGGFPVGGGPSLGADSIIRTNKTEINENLTFPASAPFYNGSSVGPITITGSYTVTVPAGNTYTII